MNLTLQCLLFALAGQLFHLLVIKLPAQKKRRKLANMEFSLTEYLKEDWMALSGSLVAILIAVFAIDELAIDNAFITKRIKLFYTAVGLGGSSWLLSYYSRYDKETNKVVDRKTNEADGIETSPK